jgi:hypothetical protein
VRVPSDELRDEVPGDVVDREAVGILGGDRGVEQHLQRHVAELLAHRGPIVLLDRVVQLVALLDEVLEQGGVGLLGVPRAAAGRAQPVHHGDGVEQRRAGNGIGGH